MRKIFLLIPVLALISPLAHDGPGAAPHSLRIETGHCAAIMAVSGGPTPEVGILDSVKSVMKNGTPVRNEFSGSDATKTFGAASSRLNL